MRILKQNADGFDKPILKNDPASTDNGYVEM